MRIHGRRTPSVVRLAERLEDVNIGIRWGGPRVPGALNGECRLLNGLEQLEKLQENNVKIPWFTTDKKEAMWRFADSCIIGRKLNHSQGKDIRFNSDIPEEYSDWYYSDYFVEFYTSIAEWRFHIFKGKSIARGKKVFTLGEEEGVDYPIRSRRNGYRLDHSVDPPSHLRELAKKSVKAVGYDFGAVDIIQIGDSEGSGIVLEVNSRPGLLDEYTLSKYENAIRKFSEEGE